MGVGLALVPRACGPHPGDSILGLGICTFWFGSLAGAGGLYMKARAVQAGPAAPKPQPKRIRGGSDLCGSETPVIHCRVHDVHVCGNCLADHYGFRSSALFPITRRPTPSKDRRLAAK